MAKLKMPLLSGTASGKLGKKLVYSMRHNISQTRNFYYPKKAPSGEQLAQRYIIGLLTARWQTMTDVEKAPYIAGALASEKTNGKPLTGFNYWIKTAMSDLSTHYGMMAFYPFNEGSGRLAKDYSGNDLHLTLFPVTPSNSVMWADSENKKFGKCLENNASARYAVTSIGTGFNFTTAFSFCFWVRFNASSGNYEYPFSQYTNFYFRKNINDSLQYVLYLNGISVSRSLVASYFMPGKWVHFALTFFKATTGNNLVAYLNGKAVSLAHVDGEGTPVNRLLYVASQSSTLYPLNGAVDNLLLVRRALSASEILKIYNLMAVDKERQNLP